MSEPMKARHPHFYFWQGFICSVGVHMAIPRVWHPPVIPLGR